MSKKPKKKPARRNVSEDERHTVRVVLRMPADAAKALERLARGAESRSAFAAETFLRLLAEKAEARSAKKEAAA